MSTALLSLFFAFSVPPASTAADTSSARPSPAASTPDGIPIQRPHHQRELPDLEPPALPPLPLVNPFTGEYERSSTPRELQRGPQCAEDPRPVHEVLKPFDA